MGLCCLFGGMFVQKLARRGPALRRAQPLTAGLAGDGSHEARARCSDTAPHQLTPHCALFREEKPGSATRMTLAGLGAYDLGAVLGCSCRIGVAGEGVAVSCVVLPADEGKNEHERQ